jgi:hypothetical protein
MLCGGVMAPVFAQPPAATPAAPRANPAVQARHEIFVMERVLEQKVQYGVQRLNEQLRAAGMPEMVLFAGAARARGTRLVEYGVFFDLEVPALRPSMNMLLSLRMMERPDPAIADALGALRSLQRAMSDAAMAASFESALRQLEARMGSPAPTAGTVSAAVADNRPVAQAPSPAMADPADVYVKEVRSAVIDAMLDHSGPMQIGPDDWLTVGARDGMDPRFVTGDPGDVPRTMIIRLRGSDLAAFRAGRLSREEAVRRVDVADF